jgi:K+-sensing histidine kinase KdpD
LLDVALIVTEIDPEKSIDNMRPYKLSNLIEYAVNDNRKLIAEKNVDIIYPQDKEITEIIIDPGLVKEVLNIFIRRGVKNSPEHGIVKLEMHESIDRIEMHIHDPAGDRIPNDQLEILSNFLSNPQMLDPNK